MQAQGIDLQIASFDEAEQLSANFTAHVASLGVDPTRQAVAFMNEYKNNGVCVIFFFII